MNKKLIALMATFFIVLLVGCECIYDDLSTCQQFVEVQFYNQTPCDRVTRHYSQLSSSKRVHLYMYQSGLLLKEYKLSLSMRGDTSFVKVPSPGKGSYTFVAWCEGEYAPFSYHSVAALSTFRVSLAGLSNGGISNTTFSKLWGGASNISLVDHSSSGTVVDTVPMNLMQKDNTLRFSISGLDPDETYLIKVSDPKASYSANGESVAANVVYTVPLNKSVTNPPISVASLSMLNIDSRATLAIIDSKGRDILSHVEHNLQGIINMGVESHKVNFSCAHDFNIELKVVTGERIKVYVLPYNLILREVILG